MLKTVALIVASIIGGVILQGFLRTNIPIIPVVPDLLLLILVQLALDYPGLRTLLVAFAIGLMSDAISGRYLGPCAGAMIISYLLVYIIGNRLSHFRNWTLAALCFVVSIVKSTVALSILITNIPQAGVDWSQVELFLLEAGLTALVGPLVINLLRRGNGGGVVYARRAREQWVR